MEPLRLRRKSLHAHLFLLEDRGWERTELEGGKWVTRRYGQTTRSHHFLEKDGGSLTIDFIVGSV